MELSPQEIMILSQALRHYPGSKFGGVKELEMIESLRVKLMNQYYLSSKNEEESLFKKRLREEEKIKDKS